jgi:hypothetical protein
LYFQEKFSRASQAGGFPGVEAPGNSTQFYQRAGKKNKKPRGFLPFG